ncbi:hypothetical protein [Streptomyces sp. NPDC006552]|uniref:hypothetical protein n=1 Tax=Streptomyces sp. NPDC006552 TaxID=3157179 RepID=UPI0033AF3ECF
MLDRVRKSWSSGRKKFVERLHDGDSARASLRSGAARQRPHNLFEAAAAYVAAGIEDDQERVDEAAGWVEPSALVFGVDELARRAVIVLAQERDESPRVVARRLLGLPAA